MEEPLKYMNYKYILMMLTEPTMVLVR